ncbi:MAG: PadR family transcriptional regulator [Rhodospirillales bacterium]
MRHHTMLSRHCDGGHRADRGAEREGWEAHRGPGGGPRGGPREEGGFRRGFDRHRHEPGGPRGRRRMFESGELRLVFLLLLEGQPRHGYDLIREIEARTGGAYAPSPGVVYPTLSLLEDMDQVQAQATEGTRKLYAITPAGLAYLEENRKEAEATMQRLEALRLTSEALDAGPVFRAMTNLKTALQQRLSGGADKTVVLAMADAIDEAARKIERL